MKSNPPTHEEIAQRAQKLWEEYGKPGGRDTEIWLEAERELTDSLTESPWVSDPHPASYPAPESPAATGPAERAKAETAAESVVEFHISPATSDEEAMRAALQRKPGRAPEPPKPAPPESAKPRWDRHRSA